MHDHWFKFFVLSCLIFPPFLHAQKCREIPLDHLTPTEAGFCFECLIKKSNQNNISTLTSIVPTIDCFEKSINKRKKGTNTFCKRGRPSVLKTENRSICPTNEYIKTTAHVFHEVSQCLGIKDPSYFFALINRESRFQITAKSQTGASCYGQLTGIAIADINKRFIPLLVENGNKCKTVNDHFEKLEARRGLFNFYKTKDAICKASSNPYTCMFYSAVYYKKNLEKARKLVDQMDLITFKAPFYRGKPNQTLAFKNERNLEKFLRKNPDIQNLYKNNEIKLKRISIFQDKEMVAQTLTLKGYNAGPQTIRNHFKRYTHSIKSILWNPKNSLQKTYAKQIFNKKPWGIHSSDFIETYGKYVQNNYQLGRINHLNGKKFLTSKQEKELRKLKRELRRRKEEHGNYAKHVFQDLDNLVTKPKNLNPSCGTLSTKDIIKPKRQFEASQLI